MSLTKSSTKDKNAPTTTITTSATQAVLETKTSTKFTYATLMETNGEECESWLYFIKYQGNEKNLKQLQDQLEQVEWFIMDDLSTFDLDLDFLVCETTAKEMTKIDLNHESFNRKFDGELKSVNFGFKTKYKNGKKIQKVFDTLGYGQIENFIDNEDIDPEDLATHTESDSEDTDSSSDSDNSDTSEVNKKKTKKLPPSLLQEIPRVAKFRRKGKKKR